jgi:hypothetical protein
LLGVLLWFGAELVTGGGQAGLAERLLGGMQTLWPVLVILSCRRRTGPSPDRSGARWLAAAFAVVMRAGPRSYPPADSASGPKVAGAHGELGEDLAQLVLDPAPATSATASFPGLVTGPGGAGG